MTALLAGVHADPARGPGLLRRLAAVATMLGGAAAGAWLVLQVSPAAALGLAAGLLALVTAGASAAARRPPPGDLAPGQRAPVSSGARP